MNADVTQMDADVQREGLNRISHAVIGAAQTVSTRLGFGFLEKVYENALLHEMRRRGLHVDQQRPVHVYYDEEIVGDYIPDLMVEEQVIVEVKAVVSLERAHRLQCLNYLRATDRKICLLLNFGRPQLQVARVVCHF